MSGMIKYLIQTAIFNDFSCIHYDDVPAKLGSNSKVMGDKQKRHIKFCDKILDEFYHLGLDGYIKGSRRLIGD